MNIYTPDVWEVLEFYSPEYGITEKVLAGWYGGWAGAESWKLNSGITKTEIVGDWIEFTGYTGSIYRCHKNSRKMSGYTMSIYNSFLDQLKDQDGCYVRVSEREYK